MVFTLCADDFGASASICDAILSLGHSGRINATSVMVTGSEVDAAAPDLAALPAVAAGLHVTLTDGQATRPSDFAPGGILPHVDRLTVAALARRLPLDEIAAEVERQFDRFEALFGAAPAFVDGHQHSHVLPGIRGVVLGIAARRAPRAWVRTCEDKMEAIMRRGVSRWRATRSALLSAGMTAAAAHRGLTCNAGFAGLYDLGGSADYAALFPRWLEAPGPHHLVICHPDRNGTSGRGMAANRAREYRYLAESPPAPGLSAAANGGAA